MKTGTLSAAAMILLLVSCALASEPEASTAAANETEMNIVETAIAAGNFNTLVQAVEAAGLADTLSGAGPFTVFAPTDEAFAKVPKEQLDALLGNKVVLTAVLTYHVVPGEVMSSDLTNGMKVKTVEGQDLTINITDEGVMVNDAKVIAPDVLASNGVIHAIDTVLMPPAVSRVQEVAGEIKEGAAEAKAGIEDAKATVKETKAAVEEAKATAEQAVPATPGFELVLALSGILAVAYLTFARRS